MDLVTLNILSAAACHPVYFGKFYPSATLTLESRVGFKLRGRLTDESRPSGIGKTSRGPAIFTSHHTRVQGHRMNANVTLSAQLSKNVTWSLLGVKFPHGRFLLKAGFLRAERRGSLRLVALKLCSRSGTSSGY